MILFLADGNQIRGDLIASATLRSDLAPVPVTLEADIRVGDSSIEEQLVVDQLVNTASGDKFRIIKSEKIDSKEVQGPNLVSVVRIAALLDSCHAVSFVRSRAIVKEQASLSAIYRAAGATVNAIQADFPVPRFCCPVGGTPTFDISRLLQEEGGVVRWKEGKLEFMRLPDLFKQEPLFKLPHNAAENIESGFLERHEIPWFYSLDDTGALIFGNREKPRTTRFAPFQNEQKLRNMTRCLVRRKVAKVPFDARICAGDLIEFTDDTKLAVVTAAHAWIGGINGGTGENYSRLWLGSL